MEGMIWINNSFDEYYPKVDDGICLSQIVNITSGKVTDEQKVELGPVGTKLVKNLLNIPGIDQFFVKFDSVYIPGPSVSRNRWNISRTEVARAICQALG